MRREEEANKIKREREGATNLASPFPGPRVTVTINCCLFLIFNVKFIKYVLICCAIISPSDAKTKNKRASWILVLREKKKKRRIKKRRHKASVHFILQNRVLVPLYSALRL